MWTGRSLCEPNKPQWCLSVCLALLGLPHSAPVTAGTGPLHFVENRDCFSALAWYYAKSDDRNSKANNEGLPPWTFALSGHLSSQHGAEALFWRVNAMTQSHEEQGIQNKRITLNDVYPSDFLAEKGLQSGHVSLKGAWAWTLFHLWRDCEYELTMSVTEWSRFWGCSEQEAEGLISDIRRTNLGHVTLSHKNVTVKSRRLERKHFSRQNARKRKQRERDREKENDGCHAPVTSKKPVLSSSSSSSSSIGVSKDTPQVGVEVDSKKPPTPPEKNQAKKPTWGDIKDRWNRVADSYNLPKVQVMTDTRKTHYKSVVTKFPDFWQVIFREFPLLNDFAIGVNDTGWKISFDYLIERKKGFVKLMEGGWRRNGQDPSEPKVMSDAERIRRSKIEVERNMQ